MAGAKRKRQSGQSLIETLLAVSILATVVLVAAQYIMLVQKDLGRQKVLAVRTRVANSLIRLAGLHSSIRSSAMEANPENIGLRACLYGSWPFCDGRAGVWQDFRLYGPFLTVTGAGTIETSGAITGTQAYPMRFSPSGEPCDTAGESCPPDSFPIETYTEFQPYCPPMFHSTYNDSRLDQEWTGPLFPGGLIVSDACWRAKTIVIRLTVRMTPGQTASSPGFGINVAPTVTELFLDAERPYTSL